MRSSGFLWIMALIMILMDLYVFQVIKMVTGNTAHKWRLIIFSAYWLVSILSLLVVVSLPYISPSSWPKGIRTYAFAIIIGLFFSKLIASMFFAVDDIRRGGMWLIGKLFSNPSLEVSQEKNGITRSMFLSWLGLGLGTSLFGSLVYGFSNKYNYQIRRVKLSFERLPSSFRGLKILQISDIHSGSFTNKDAVNHGVDKILKEEADIILFTGDIVNDHAHEMENYMDVFSRLKAPMGVYSTLGNHDYGEYDLPHGLSHEERREVVRNNIAAVQKVHEALGWKLLMNEHIPLRRGEEAIALLGVENWSMKGNFPKYGKMEEAYPGTEAYAFKILMSHDPSHWDGEIRMKYPDIDLTLAGHTHGMQFGVEIPGFKWSPVEYMYKRWAGLYEEGNQKLYVNRGYGFIGYPGRVGILPEITVIELV